MGRQQGLSFGGTEVSLVCDITSSAGTDRIFSFFFSTPVTLLAFDLTFMYCTSVKSDIPEL